MSDAEMRAALLALRDAVREYRRVEHAVIATSEARDRYLTAATNLSQAMDYASVVLRDAPPDLARIANHGGAAHA